MKRKLVITAALVGCFIICFAAVAGLSGTWKGSIKTPDGNVYPVTYIFNIQGDSLTGTAQAVGDPKTITEGKIMGSDFTFNVADDNGNPLPHSGKYYADGDSVSINVVYQGSTLHGSLKRADQ